MKINEMVEKLHSVKRSKYRLEIAETNLRDKILQRMVDKNLSAIETDKVTAVVSVSERENIDVDKLKTMLSDEMLEKIMRTDYVVSVKTHSTTR